jgi:hypothetical protein
MPPVRTGTRAVGEEEYMLTYAAMMIAVVEKRLAREYQTDTGARPS